MARYDMQRNIVYGKGGGKNFEAWTLESYVLRASYSN